MDIHTNEAKAFLMWKLSSSFTIVEAVLLMQGVLPEGENCKILKNWREDEWPQGCLPLVKFLKSALSDKKVQGEPLPIDDYNEGIIEGSIDIETSRIDANSLTKLLKEKGVTDHFFNNVEEAQATYLDESNDNYAPKLAAAVHAWEAISSDSELQNGKTPKQNAEKWLRKNAALYGLNIEETGKLNESAIEEIAKIVNWKPQGGASKTPTKKKTSKNSSKDDGLSISKLNLPTPKNSKDSQSVWDEDIPF